MSKPVLFVTGLGRELKRAENMNALYESYQGEKTFISMKDMNYEDGRGCEVNDNFIRY